MRAFKNGFLYSFGKYVFYILTLLFIVFLIKFFNIPLPNFLHIDEVHALTSGYSSSSFDVQYSNCGSQGRTCGGYGSWRGSHSVGERIYSPNDYLNIYNITRYSFQIVGNSNYVYKEGNTYTWTIIFASSSEQLDNLQKHFVLSSLIGSSGTDSTNADSSAFSSYNYSLTRDGSTAQQYRLIINFVPSKNLKFVRAIYGMPDGSNSYIVAYGFPGNAYYVSTSITYQEGVSNLIIAQSGAITNGFNKLEQIISGANAQSIQNQQETNSNLNKINDSINDDNVDNNQATSYFSNFQSDDFGLSDIVSIPLNYINQLSTNSCVPLSLSLPFVNQSVNLPCMNEVYNTHFSSFLSIWHIISTGIISYWVCINIFASVKGFKDPQSDKVEVLDL